MSALPAGCFALKYRSILLIIMVIIIYRLAGNKAHMIMNNLFNVFVFLPFAKEVSEGYVFTPGCGGGSPGPGPGGVQAQAWGGGSRPRPGGVYPSMHWGRHHPLPSRRLLLRTVRILMECILVCNVLVVFVSHSIHRGKVCPVWPLPMMHWNSPHRDRPHPSSGHSLSRHVQTSSTWTSLYRGAPVPGNVQTFSLWSTYSWKAGSWHPIGMLSSFSYFCSHLDVGWSFPPVCVFISQGVKWSKQDHTAPMLEQVYG